MASYGPDRPLSIELDPNAPGTIVRWNCILESIKNIGMGTTLLFSPATVLADYVRDPANLSPVLAASARSFGFCLLVVTIPMLMAIPNTVSGIESRKPLLWTYGICEAVEVVIFAYRSILDEDFLGLTPAGFRKLTSVVSVLMGLRFLMLLHKPQWLGRYRIVDEKSKHR
ncbi:MAG: hypothetical protein M1820_004667 [Bogoriella megaspora]|nr:MAG: hypothetical protein M1820_004667 [Bogoriella megaspora]